MTVATAPGKCILFGEHAVLYGSSAVAVAIDARVRVEVREAESGPRVDGQMIGPGRHPHVRSMLESFGLPADAAIDVRVDSDLFSAAGLGSSAALSVAAGAALIGRTSGGAALTGDDLDRIAAAGHAAEAAAQGGRASPTDTSTAAHGGCILIADQPIEGIEHLSTRSIETPDGPRSWQVHSVSIPEALSDVSLVIGWTGVHASTAALVAQVADLLERQPSKREQMARIAQVTRMGVDALQSGNAEGVGAAMEMCHVLLASLGVSSVELDRLIDASRPFSLGAKLTGAGGGGCMIALSRQPRRCSEAIELAGGRTIISRIGAPGVHIESD